MNKDRKSVFLFGVAGNVLEYYDFTVYAVFSVAIGKVFFSATDNEFLQILYSLGVFAVGFFTRPIGGVLFGYIGDKYGRRVSLIASMSGMTFATFGIGLVPGYEQIGYLAPVFLIMMRLIQGLCLSGEGVGAAVFVLEHYQNLKPGLITGLVHSAGLSGTLFATLVGVLLSILFPDVEYAWRFAFIIGGVMGLIGLYFRSGISETPTFLMLSKKKKVSKMPFLDLMKQAKKSVIITIALGACASSIVYLVKAYIIVFFYDVMGFTKMHARMYLTYSVIVMMIAMPVSGYISDRVGRFRTTVFSVLAIFLLVLPCLALISSNEQWMIILSLTTLAWLGGTVAGVAYIFIISLFTPQQRFSGVAFSYNFGIALFGGTSAAIYRWLVEKTGLDYAPAFYILATSGTFLLLVYFLRDSIKKTIELNAEENSNL